jgi:MFS family permease
VTVDIKSAIASRAIHSGGRLKVQSALNPALWLCGIICIPALCVAGLSPNPPWWIPWLILAPVALAAIGFLFLLFFDRDKLQSEDYQIKKMSLELYEQKGMSAPATLPLMDSTSPDNLLSSPDGAE